MLNFYGNYCIMLVDTKAAIDICASAFVIFNAFYCVTRLAVNFQLIKCVFFLVSFLFLFLHGMGEENFISS